MILGGFQKLTLVDFPGTVASIVFTKGCLFRCPFCHNPELVEPKNRENPYEESWWKHLEEKKGFIDGVVVTGGEPTIHKDLPDFIRRIKQMGYKVKLDTNGVSPDMVTSMLADGLIDYIAMDLKDTWGEYQRIANITEKRVGLLENCRKTFNIIRASGVPYEWRTTILPGVHTEEDLVDIAKELIPGERYYIQDINYAVTLRNLKKDTSLSVPSIVKRLTTEFPELLIEGR